MITYDNELIKYLKNSEIEAINLNYKYVGTEHFILSILKNDNDIKKICNKLNLTYDNFYNEVKSIKLKSKSNIILYTPLLKRILLMSSEDGKVTVKKVFCRLIENGEGIAFTILSNLNIDIRKLYKELNDSNNKLSYGINLNEENKLYHEKVICREKEINEIIEILCRKNKNNPILIGPAGVGKTAIVEELAYRINEKKVPDELLNKKIISINLAELISGTRYRGEFEEKMQNMIKEFESNPNLILFIDEIHTLVGAGGAEGAIDASNIMKPYLARNKLKCIGATTNEEYNKSILNDKALNRRFYPIEIKEPSFNETIDILKNTKKYYEDYHNVSINNEQIKLIVTLSKKYLKNKFEPDKSLDILDKICTKAKLMNYKEKNDKKNLKLNSLLKEKEKSIKNKDFKNATKLNNEIIKLKSKSNKIIVNNMFIKDCFNIENSNYNIGFKTN